MSPMVAAEKVEKFRGMVVAPERVGVSEFARSKSWREKLLSVGCFEVVDRSGVVGYMIAPDYAEALNDRLAELEERLERAQVAAIFEARNDRMHVEMGADLKTDALTYFEENADALLEIVHDGQ